MPTYEKGPTRRRLTALSPEEFPCHPGKTGSIFLRAKLW